MADEKKKKTRRWKRSLSNRCSRVLGARTTCYPRTRRNVLKRSVAVEVISLFVSLPCPRLEREKEGESFPWRARNRTITCHVCVLSRNSKTPQPRCILDDERGQRETLFLPLLFEEPSPPYFSSPPSSYVRALPFAFAFTTRIKSD